MDASPLGVSHPLKLPLCFEGGGASTALGWGSLDISAGLWGPISNGLPPFMVQVSFPLPTLGKPCGMGPVGVSLWVP